jgi:hypothetical protein
MKRLMFGCLPEKHDPQGRTLMMAKYAAQLPAPPDHSTNLQRMMANLKISDVTSIMNMDGNDQYGDCVVAGTAHAETGWNGLIGIKKVPSKCAVLRQYKKLTGGQDTGLVVLDTLKIWRNNPFFGETIDAFVKNDVTNQVQIMQSIDLFGGVAVGMDVQENAIADFQAGKIWTPGKLTGDGHFVWPFDYDKGGVWIWTWGGKVYGTWDWWVCCVRESYPILPKEAHADGFAPNFPYVMLQEDLNAVAA